MRYYVTLDGTTVEVERTAEGVRIDGRTLEAELARPDGRLEAHLRLDGRGFGLLARRVEGGWWIQHRGREFRVEVEDERTHAIRELTGEAGRGGPDADLRAPMPGLVVAVLVEPGQRVEAGAGLVVVEAMKMENELRAEAVGVVASVEVEVGQTVNRDDVLVTFEAEEA